MKQYVVRILFDEEAQGSDVAITVSGILKDLAGICGRFSAAVQMDLYDKSGKRVGEAKYEEI